MTARKEDLLQAARVVFGALVLHPELGEPSSVAVSRHVSAVYGLTLDALLAWANLLTPVRLRCHSGGGAGGQFVVMEGKLGDLDVEVSCQVTHPAACARIVSEPLTLDVIRQVRDLVEGEADAS